MTTYLITGGSGMLGRDLRRALSGREVFAPSRSELDITRADAVNDAVAGIDVVINTAAFTAVDDAETAEDTAFAINATGAENIARAAQLHGSRMVQISTDYVFQGNTTLPYPEDAQINPLGAYGRSKAAGERLVRASLPSALIVRSAWMYGAHGNNFVRTLLRLATEREEIPVVTDQIGQPSWSRDVAEAIVTLIDANVSASIFHATNSGQASWFDFAKAIFAEAGLDPGRVVPSDSASFVRPAPRPSFSVLGHAAWARIGNPAPRNWREALTAAKHDGVLTLPN